MINEENSLGALTRTYIGRTLAHIEGTNPATGTARYYFHDNLGSSRSVRNADKSLYASFEHTPYGEIYATTGAASSIDRRFTGHTWDPAAYLYYAPYRYYSPSAARWMTRDPVGLAAGLNLFAFVRGNPVLFFDLLGLCREQGESFGDCWHRMHHWEKCQPETTGQFWESVSWNSGAGIGLIWAYRSMPLLRESTLAALYNTAITMGSAATHTPGAAITVLNSTAAAGTVSTVIVPAAVVAGSATVTWTVSYAVSRRYLKPVTNAAVDCATPCTFSEDSWFYRASVWLHKHGLI